MPLSAFDRLFWAAGLAGHLLLLGVLFGKHRASSFPAFTALVSYNVLRTAVLYLVLAHGSDNAYLVTYGMASLVDVILQFAVVYEVASHVFRPLGSWAPDVRKGLHLLIWISLVIASGLVWLEAPMAARWQFVWLKRANLFTAALESELFLGLVILSVTVGLPWKTHVARISHGLGIYSLWDVLIEAGHGTGSGSALHHTLTHARMVVYVGCLCYWIVTLWQEAPEARVLPPSLQEELRNLEARVAYDLYTLRSWRKP